MNTNYIHLCLTCFDFFDVYNCNFSDKGSFNEFYVGASDLAVEGKWEWIVPGASNYFNFHETQPNNYHIKYPTFTADCADIHTDGTLFDDYCGQKQAFICEI